MLPVETGDFIVDVHKPIAQHLALANLHVSRDELHTQEVERLQHLLEPGGNDGPWQAVVIHHDWLARHGLTQSQANRFTDGDGLAFSEQRGGLIPLQQRVVGRTGALQNEIVGLHDSRSCLDGAHSGKEQRTRDLMNDAVCPTTWAGLLWFICNAPHTRATIPAWSVVQSIPGDGPSKSGEPLRDLLTNLAELVNESLGIVAVNAFLDI